MVPPLAELAHFAISVIPTIYMLPGIGALPSATTLAKPMNTCTMQQHFEETQNNNKIYGMLSCEIITKLK